MTRSSSSGNKTSRKRILYLRSEKESGTLRRTCCAKRQYAPPDFALLLLLTSEPMRPLVRDELVVESVFCKHDRRVDQRTGEPCRSSDAGTHLLPYAE
jgi:hypothetical protein